MQQELLFEIGTEELPAGFILPALDRLQTMTAAKLSDLSLSYQEITVAGTPRRLTLCVKNLQDRQEDSQETFLGPAVKAAFDEENNPTKAAEGFARSKGATASDLEIVDTPKGKYVQLVIDQKGESTEKLLSSVLPALITELPFPKSMRWGSGKASFARPIQWILALYNGRTISLQINDIRSDTLTKGHRFMAPDAFRAENFEQYQNELLKAHVIVDIETRKQAVLEEVTKAAASVDGIILPDEELLLTVTNLVEKPHAVCGTFEDRFLELPREVLITSMREHQKYFAVADNDGKLQPHFIAVNNTGVRDKKLAAEGHQRVIRARLEDAFFFFTEDQQKPLDQRVEELDGIIFQTKLGTMKEKTERLVELAGFIAAKIAPEHEAAAKRAAYLSKADLLSDMVGEFTSLQGIMGRYYAALMKEPEGVCLAIEDHYKPVRAGSPLPETITGTIVSLADRLDTIVGCFGIGQIPSGTADPFGLRRLTLGVIHILVAGNIDLSLETVIAQAIALYGDKLTEEQKATKYKVLEFIKGRFANDQVSAGIPLETVEAVTTVAFDNIIDCRNRINALQEISSQETFTLLAGSFKRVKNIIKDFDQTSISSELLSETEEVNLFKAFQAVGEKVDSLVRERKYALAMQEILTMKEPIDRFFDSVMVMVEDSAIRRNRLALLSAIAQMFLQIGDFSRMSSLAGQNG